MGMQPLRWCAVLAVGLTGRVVVEGCTGPSCVRYDSERRFSHSYQGPVNHIHRANDSRPSPPAPPLSPDLPSEGLEWARNFTETHTKELCGGFGTDSADDGEEGVGGRNAHMYRCGCHQPSRSLHRRRHQHHQPPRKQTTRGRTACVRTRWESGRGGGGPVIHRPSPPPPNSHSSIAPR